MKGFAMKQNIESGTCLGDRNECAVPATGSRVKRTPIAYYGGKLNMLKHILPMFPEHKIYVEPFLAEVLFFLLNSHLPSRLSTTLLTLQSSFTARCSKILSICRDASEQPCMRKGIDLMLRLLLLIPARMIYPKHGRSGC